MKILYLVTGLSTGGAEIMLYNLLAQIDRQRFSPIVVSLIDRGTLGDRIAALDIPVYTLGLLPGSLPTPAIIRRLVAIVRQIKPDLIQGWMYHGNLAAQLANLFYSPRVPVLWSIHHSISSLNNEKKSLQLIIQVGKYISRYPQQIIFVSQTSKVQHEALGYCRDRSCVIPNGFDPEKFAPSAKAKAKIRAELGLSANNILIGMMARYHPMKDHNNFLQAAALIASKYSEVRFVLAGTDVNLENVTLQRSIGELGIGDRLHLLGERRDMPELIAALDILTSASAYGEAFPLIVGEAMSSGIPCVVTDVGDSGAIVGETGRIVPPRHPAALANAWQELIDIGVEGRESLGKLARQRIIQDFTLDAIVSQYEILYAKANAKS
ncbi:MAG: glycosyltransferase [Cyanosarcina radialis HA8281-LM2]|jgi:glycosyltransferase involved in cell wall biosynthesis|nr:glycosyltransferase [Cyanosarcina radialis HA8281-LM2]